MVCDIAEIIGLIFNLVTRFVKVQGTQALEKLLNKLTTPS